MWSCTYGLNGTLLCNVNKVATGVYNYMHARKNNIRLLGTQRFNVSFFWEIPDAFKMFSLSYQ